MCKILFKKNVRNAEKNEFFLVQKSLSESGTKTKFYLYLKNIYFQEIKKGKERDDRSKNL